MKRTIRCLLPSLALLATVSCATLYDTEALQSVGNVAVISIQAHRNVVVEGDDDLATAARGWARGDSLDLVPAAERVRSDLFGRLESPLPFTLAAELSLLASEAYQGLGADGIELLSPRQAAVPPGYLAVPPAKRNVVKELIARFPDVDGFLWAEVSYTIVVKNVFMGTLFATMRADLTITVVDRSARTILRHMESAEDPTEMKIPVVSVLKTSEVAAAALRATGRAGTDMASWLEARSAR